MLTFETTKIGDKVKLDKIGPYFYFTDMIKHAKTLEKNKEYTVKVIGVLSSWTSVEFEETGDLVYNLAWFKKI